MKNYTYNGLNAQEIANKITSNEEAFIKMEFDLLSFEDKCDYVAHYNAFYHPLRCHVKNFNEIKKII